MYLYLLSVRGYILQNVNINIHSNNKGTQQRNSTKLVKSSCKVKGYMQPLSYQIQTDLTTNQTNQIEP